MLEAYSIGITAAAESAVPFNSVSIVKGCTAKLASPTSVELNKCGVYMVAVDATASAETTLQLTKDGVAQPQAQSTGTACSFTTLVQVPTNNSACACASPVTLQVLNSAAVTLDNANITITKIC